MKEYRITILGSGTCVPSLKRSSSSVLLEGTDEKILVDIGPGTIRRLLEVGVVIDEVDAIMLTHFHPDHSAELPAFIFSTKYPAPMRREKSIRLIGGTGVRNFYENLVSAFQNYLALPEGLLKIEELPECGKNDRIFTDFTFEWMSVAHRPESRAFRFTTGTDFSVVYSGDTDYSENLVQLARNAHILICESAFPDGAKTDGHLTPSLAGRIASMAGVRHLVLTHFYPVCEGYDIEAQCRKTYSGRLTLARDLLEIEIG